MPLFLRVDVTHSLNHWGTAGILPRQSEMQAHLRRMYRAWRLTRERHYAKKMHLQIASNTALETHFGDW
jgi:hypothetical protein